MYLKRFSSYLILLSIITTSCSTTHKAQEVPVLAKVESVDKIADKDKSPASGTKTGVATGGAAGVFLGGIAGGAAAVGASIATFGLAAPATPALVAGGATMGGVIGATIGGGAGYVYDYQKAGSGLYEYQVRTEYDENITLRQVDSTPFTVGQEVEIIWEVGNRKILPLKTK